MDGSTHAATWILSKQLNMINFTADFRSKNVIGPTVSHTFPGYNIEQEIGFSVFINSTKSRTNRELSDLARETNSYSDSLWRPPGRPRRSVWVCRLETSPAPGTGTELNDAQPELMLSSAGKHGFRIIRHMVSSASNLNWKRSRCRLQKGAGDA